MTEKMRNDSDFGAFYHNHEHFHDGWNLVHNEVIFKAKNPLDRVKGVMQTHTQTYLCRHCLCHHRRHRRYRRHHRGSQFRQC